MDNRTIMDIYGLFIAIVVNILLWGSTYYNSFLHIPHYVMGSIILLMIPILIDGLNEIAKESKIKNKSNG